MGINPFDYKDLDYNDYIKALDEKPKTITTVVIGKTQYYKTESQLPKVTNDITCKAFVLTPKKEVKEVKEIIKPHEYAKSKEGLATYHKIKNGETLDSIAKSYNVTVISIMKLNKIKNKNDIKPKQNIRVL